MCSLGQLQVTKWLPSSPFFSFSVKRARADESLAQEPTRASLGYGALYREDAGAWAWL